MKKSKLTLGLLSGLFSVGALAACSSSGPEYNSEGVILTYEVNGTKIEYTADQLFEEKIVDSEHAQEMFNQVYKLVVRNYFTLDNPDGAGTNTGIHQMDEIKSIAARNVQIDKDTAEKNADTNDTSYSTEFETILSSHNCENEDELFDYYVFEEQQTKFKESFYKIYADEINTKWSNERFNWLRDSSTSDTGDKKYAGYLETKVPYHISHILVNVEDSGSNNYWNGTVSQANVEHLKRVVDGLKDKDRSFGSVAFDESDDGSKSTYGDLGIVDKDKATEESDKFVKEFILGLYTYDNLYNPNEIVRNRATADGSAIKAPAGLAAKPNYVSSDVFDEMYADREVEGSLVLGSSSANFYPRNIWYNQYLNDHSVYLIEQGTNETKTDNFKELTIAGESHKVLCVKGTSNPILVTRAGASYQGIHFIVVNRSPLEGTGDKMRDYTVNGVKLSEYYTTKYPTQNDYPKDNDGKDLQTYVNPYVTTTAKYKERAEAVEDRIKNFDSNIEHEIYKKYMEVEGAIKFADTPAAKKVENTINSWLKRSEEQKRIQTNESWDEYWEDYTDMLAMQKEQSSKKLKKGCAIAFNIASTKKTQLEVDALGSGDGWKKQIQDAFTAKYGADEGIRIANIWDDSLTELVAKYPEAERAAKKAELNALSYNKLFNEIGGACNDGETHK